MSLYSTLICANHMTMTVIIKYLYVFVVSIKEFSLYWKVLLRGQNLLNSPNFTYFLVNSSLSYAFHTYYNDKSVFKAMYNITRSMHPYHFVMHTNDRYKNIL